MTVADQHDQPALEALADAWEAVGMQAIANVRELDPARYVKIIAAVSAASRRPDDELELDRETVLALRNMLRVDR